MKFGKSLVLTLTLSALAGLTSCTQSPSTKWTELEKQNMILNANYAMPNMPFKATLDWGELPEEGYVQGPTSYNILVEAKAEKLNKWIEKMAPAEDGELGVGDWYYVGDTSAGENVYAIYTSEKYETFCYAYVDAEIGQITIQTLTFEFAGMAEIFDRHLGLYGVEDKSFSYCFGENFPELEIDPDETKVYQAWSGPEKEFKAAGFNASYFMVYGYEADKLATFREGLADAGWHIYGYTRSDGSKNSSIYCKEGMDGGFRMEEDTGSDGTPLLWVMMYTDMDDPHFRDGEDVCHPSIDVDGALAALKTNLTLTDENITDNRKEYSGAYEFTVNANEGEDIEQLFTRVKNANDPLLELDEESYQEIFQEVTPEPTEGGEEGGNTPDSLINEGEEPTEGDEEPQKVLVKIYGEFVKGGVTVAIYAHFASTGELVADVEVFDANWKYGYTAAEAAHVMGIGWGLDADVEPAVEKVGGTDYWVYSIAGSLLPKTTASTNYGVADAEGAWNLFGLDYVLARGVAGDIIGKEAAEDGSAIEVYLNNGKYYAYVGISSYTHQTAGECWLAQVYVIDLVTPTTSGDEPTSALVNYNSLSIAK